MSERVSEGERSINRFIYEFSNIARQTMLNDSFLNSIVNLLVLCIYDQ